ncbi:putative ABC transport system permease protein [Natranaerovirga pectinivora]|uniref:Putative ABC transport system permease protein n=1 Tax=Natranaerovirga pectinivora TaxID=682400 RepID=A0A4R3MDD0_9FIRM|nr:ABC transporter permease [Natranaerovirga pectinivora]TCT11640.1 putative ABC transport system permease protein [Natranaerovirga pectinivora]
MRLILKLTFANIIKNKLRTFMIVLSILLSTALIYSVMSISDSVEDIFKKQLTQSVGQSEIIVTGTTQSRFFYEDFNNLHYFEYARGVVQTFGYAENLEDEQIRAILYGFDLEDFKLLYKVNTFNGNSDQVFRDNNVILGEWTADKYNLSIGDSFDININGTIYDLKVYGIMEDQHNILSPQVGRIQLLLPKTFLQDTLELDNNVTTYFIKTNGNTSIEEGKIYLENTYPDYRFEAFDFDMVRENMNMIIIPLMILIIVVLLISVFIIYSAFKVIALERLPFIGTLRSIGSTKKQTSIILLTESIFYGIIGGVLGGILGIFILKIVDSQIMGISSMDKGNPLNIHLLNMIIAIFIAILLSLLSGALPILKMIGRSIKDIMLNIINTEKKLNSKKAILGLILIICAFLLFNYAPTHLATLLTILGIIMLPIGAAFIIPFIILFLCNIINTLDNLMPSDTSKLALTNIKNDKTIHSSIVLMGIGLGVILLINTLVSSVLIEVIDIFNNVQSDIYLEKSFDSEAFDSKLSSIKGIEKIDKSYSINNITSSNSDTIIGYLYGVDDEYFSSAWSMDLGNSKDEILYDLKNSQGIIITSFIANKYNLSLNQTLALNLEGFIKEYSIIGIIDTLFNNGQVSFIHKDNFLEDITNHYSATYFIKTNMPSDEVVTSIRTQFSTEPFFIATFDEMKEMNIRNNNALFGLMKGISFIAMAIGIVGIFNNYMISFLSRKRFLAVLRSMGLSKNKMLRMLIKESLLCGVIGSISGISIGVLFLQSLKYVLYIINIPPILHYSQQEFIIILVSGIIISIISAVLPIFKTKKMSIIENLKYE